MILISLCLVSVILPLYMCHYSIQVYYKRQKYAHIPGPPCDTILSFYMGNIAEIINFMKKGKQFPDFISEWYNELKQILSITY